MRYNIQILNKIENLTTECLKRAMRIAYQTEMGVNWWNNIKASYEGYDVIYDKPAIDDCSLNDLVCFLTFNEVYTELLVRFWQVNFIDVNGYDSQLIYLLRRVYLYADDVYNSINKDNSIYGANELILDMQKITQVFDRVCNEYGEPYYDIVCECIEKYKADSKCQSYSIQKAIKDEGLFVNENRFFDICKQLGYTVIMDSDIKFVTDDYNLAIQRIRNKSNAMRMINITKYHLAAIISVLLVAAIIMGSITGVQYNKQIERATNITDAELLDNFNDIVDTLQNDSEHKVKKCFKTDSSKQSKSNYFDYCSNINDKNQIGSNTMCISNSKKKSNKVISRLTVNNDNSFTICDYNLVYNKHKLRWQIDCTKDVDYTEPTAKSVKNGWRIPFYKNVSDNNDTGKLTKVENGNAYYAQTVPETYYKSYASDFDNKFSSDVVEDKVIFLPEYLTCEGDSFYISMIVNNGTKAKLKKTAYTLTVKDAITGAVYYNGDIYVNEISKNTIEKIEAPIDKSGFAKPEYATKSMINKYKTETTITATISAK